jgi:ribonucleoside-diphosphate reductase alpha chain
MDKGAKALSEVVHFNKYARYIAEEKRRESYEENVDRYIQMMKDNYPKLIGDIDSYSSFIYEKKILPSMRAMQFAGKAITKNESRIYNCSYLPIDDYRAFSEVMFLLLGGTGVGYSVQKHHVAKLPEIKKPVSSQKYIVADSIEGWADAIKHLMKAYFGKRETAPRFDFSAIRPKGERLLTAGGKAPGPEPLKTCLFNITTILDRKDNGQHLTTLEVHDIVCFIANAVLAGGIRRAALIALFSAGDTDMLTCKKGEYWNLNPQRSRANNSAVVLRHRVTKKFFDKIFTMVEENKTGEPGIYFTNDKEWGTNPCCEIALRPFQFCNLTEINGSDIRDQLDLNSRAEAASFFGTLQAGFTDFHYLRPIWKRTTEKEALTGVGMTGICSGATLNLNLEEAVKKATAVNTNIADIIGIKPSARVSTIKPSGTTSTILGTSSGIHAWHSQYYIRNVQCMVGDDVYNYFTNEHPKLIKIMDQDPTSAVIGFPIKAPEGSILREKETALKFLNRIEKFNTEWVRTGHISGDNTNNVSATINIKDKEWEEVKKWMWEHKDSFNGLSVLPFDGGVYKDAPFTECTKEIYEEKLKLVTNVDLSTIKEEVDNTNRMENLACAGNSCEIL